MILDSALNLPDPAWFVYDTLTESEIKKTVEYLKQGCYMSYTYAGYSWCRFRCEHSQLGSREQTDGFFLWPEKFWHYVESHKVKLSVEFLNEIKKGKAMPTSFNSEFDLDTTWWMKQKGLNQNRSSFLTLDSKGCLLIRFDENADIIGQIKLRSLKILRLKSLKE